MASLAAHVVSRLGQSFLLILDAYYAVGPVFLILRKVVNDQGHRLVHVITRAKNNVTGYEDAPPKTRRRGAPRKYGNKICLASLFCDDIFEKVTIDIYRERKTILFFCKDLIWKPIQEKARFVLVIDGSERFILMSSDVTLSPEEIIRAYSYRFKIEITFKVMKHLMGAFSYHFWTRVWSKTPKNPVRDNEKRLIARTADAIEAFVNFGCIATGILQILALNHHTNIWQRYEGWVRTATSIIPSEEIVKSVLQEEHFHNFHSFSNTAMYQIIMSKRRGNEYDQLLKTG
jgi:uncharacterized membrane protein